MRQELKNIFGKVFITITVDTENRWVHTNWVGYLTQDNIKAGAFAYTEVIRKTGFSCVLNDTTEVLGSWDHSLEWVVNEWAVQAAAAGIRHFAMITTPESFAESTATNFFANNKAFEVKMFEGRISAMAWLRQYSLKG
ncbi:STAS/SEC14 domain-containing protein [Pontibacter oryzae]|uniref:STAS/SEC14 domain-containing protein n=1 Tax=Pontibacter oryzae TaxID=2304593 RepID=A0A399SI31_9BACT|nr:STAS/SEC14 domain-containing protein [Pontibacter oryzae]RIJ43180.1 STAS/SEC14 domain-containing protein [Pontibacter oryzae]